MKIEAGKFYRTRDGQKFGPMVDNGGDGWPFTIPGRHAPCWTRDGDIVEPGECRPMDLVAEWPDGPVRTVTHKEIVEGVYGIVTVDVHRNHHVVHITPEQGHQATADELRAASATLTEIADALEASK